MDIGTADSTAAVAVDGPGVAGIDEELRADVARRLLRAIARMERFLLREESRLCGSTDPTRLLGQSFIDEARHLLRGPLLDSSPAIAESTLRSAYRLIGTLANLAAWGAPASQESCAVNSFPVAAARDVVAYSRYGCAETACQETAYTTLLGFEPTRVRLLLTSSGMAAYSLIENFLLRDVLEFGDRIVMHPGVYFETQQQVRSLKLFEIEIAGGCGRLEILNAVVTHRPKVVLVDPLTNSLELRIIDLARLLDDADRLCERETWFVIDATLLSGSFDPFAGSPRRHVRVLYYESGCKYLQFGMDLGPCGVVVVEAQLAARFERLRRGMGAVAAETLVLPRASRHAYLTYLRTQTACARLIADTVARFSWPAGAPPIRAAFPAQSSHPDHAEAQCYPHLGGVIALCFANDEFNKRAPLETFIDSLMSMARSSGVALTAGVSFGFRVARIGAAWTSYDADDAFLRLSAGVDLDQAVQLGHLIARCAARFASAGAVVPAVIP